MQPDLRLSIHAEVVLREGAGGEIVISLETAVVSGWGIRGDYARPV